MSKSINGKIYHGHVDRMGFLFWVGKVFYEGEMILNRTFWTRRGAEHWLRKWVS